MKSSPLFSGYPGAVALVALASLACELVRPHLVPTNMVMAYLLVVVVAAVQLGLKPAILTAFLSVVAFDVLFVPPRFSLRVSDTEYLITFFALFIVGVVISTLVAKIQEKIDLAKNQEARTNSLYLLTRDLSAAVDINDIAEALQRAVLKNLNARLLLLLQQDGSLEQLPCNDSFELDDDGEAIARWVMQSGRLAGIGTAAFADAANLFVPIKSGTNVTAVMVLEGSETTMAGDLRLIEAFAGQAAMALERIQFSRQAEEARLQLNKHYLEQALLNSISHDLRTPLVTISGVLDSLKESGQWFDTEKRQTMLSIAADEAGRLNRFVGSLLDMTRLEAGALSPHLQECEVDELIGCAIGAIESRAGDHRIVTLVAPNLPPLLADLTLLTQALVNLLDNALKYSPSSAEITLAARCEGSEVVISVADSGPGIPASDEQRIFDKFYRVTVPEQSSGTGLGLSIAKGIIEAHGGTITATNRSEGGLLVTVRLPVEQDSRDREETT